MIRPVFETTKIDATFSIMLSSVNEFISMLETSNATEKQTIFSLDLDEKLTYLTADIIFRTIMSKKLDNQQFIEIYTAFQKFQSLAASLILSQYLGVHTIFQKIFITRRLKNEAHKIRQHIKSAIVDKQTNRVDNKDLLSTLMSIKDQDGQNFSLEELVNHITMFFLAGHETSASALTWTFYLLAIYPDIQEKAYSEVKEVIGESDITIESLRKLKLVKNIFKEALRLYPPVSFITRESLSETTMRNKTIKPDDTIVISPCLIRRHSDYWKNPDEFDPFRFNTRNEHGAYLPFGKGSRVCVGAAFAEQEALIVIASLLLKYRVELEDGFVPDPVCQLNTRSKNGMKVKLYRR